MTMHLTREQRRERAFPIPDMTDPRAGHRMTMRDLEFMTARLQESEIPLEAFGYRDSLRASLDEVCSVMLSVAAAASLTGYRHEGDAWRYACAPEFSTDADELLAGLDEVRAALLEKEPQIRRYLLSARARVFAKRSAAVFSLALDAVSRKNLPDFMMIGGIARSSRDVIGDAQAAAEEWDRDAQLPFNR
jgi:hypothetical protein